MSKLREILDKYYIVEANTSGETSFYDLEKELKTYIAEVIGEDENEIEIKELKRYSGQVYAHKIKSMTNNQLRAEQRQRAGLGNKEKTE